MSYNRGSQLLVLRNRTSSSSGSEALIRQILLHSCRDNEECSYSPSFSLRFFSPSEMGFEIGSVPRSRWTFIRSPKKFACYVVHFSSPVLSERLICMQDRAQLKKSDWQTNWTGRGLQKRTSFLFLSSVCWTRNELFVISKAGRPFT